MIIGIAGKAGAGKDTVGDYLVKNHNFTKVALADPIKRLVKDVFVLTDNQVYDRIEREKPLPQWNNWSVRKLLQVIGTEALRNNIDPQIWAKSLWYRINVQLALYPQTNFVFTDLRFPDELDYFNRHVPAKIYPTGETYGQFESWKVIRDGCDGDVGVKNHMSESFDLKTDYVLYNNTVFQDLYDQVDLLIHGG